MAIETDLNINPYFDDYDETKNFHRILFRPSTAVQARELTQLQTILQNQIERFGDSVYKEGTIIKGCNFVFDENYNYVKLPDLRVDGQTTNPDNYVGYRVVSPTSNLQAIVLSSSQGLESQNPDLHTIFVKYQNSGINGEQQYSPEEELNFYSNTNVTDTLSKVESYTVQVAPATIGGQSTNPIGKGYAFTVTDGVIFQKGHFVRVANNLTIVVSKYNSQPNNVSVGFSTVEDIITEYDDSTLYDNAAGYTNSNAPGAHRLKLTPTLQVANTNALPSSNFFSLVDWQNGKPVRLQQQTEYSQLGRELARRTYEESGNYVVNPFKVTNEAITGNSTHFNVVTSAGVAFIEGYRVENINNRGTPFRKGTDTKTVTDQVINSNFGNYILVNNVIGFFAFNSGATISLRNAAGSRLSSDNYILTPPGSEIGTAKILSVSYDSGVPGTPAGAYRFYITDIKMNSGFSFNQVRAVTYDGPSFDGVADLILENNNAVIKDANKSSLVIPTSKFAVTTVSNINYVYRTSTAAASYKIEAASGAMSTITLPAGFRFPYGTGVLSAVNERQIVVLPTQSANVATPVKSGTITANNNIVQGTNTRFVSEYDINDYININGVAGNIRRIQSIANDTYMVLSSNVTSNVASGGSHSKHYPANIPIPVSERNHYIYLPNTSSMSIQLVSKTSVNETLSSNVNIILYYDVQKVNSSPVTKQVLKNQYIRIDTALNLNGNGTITANTTSPTVTGVGTDFQNKVSAGYLLYTAANVLIGTVQSVANSTSLTLATNGTGNYTGVSYIYSAPNSVGPDGPWSLGVTDVYRLRNVFRSSNSSYTNAANSDVTSLFNLNTGQKDGIYDISTIELAPGSIGQINNGDKLTVVFDMFKSSSGSGVGFYTRNSYPVSPTESDSDPNYIRTVDIPRYTDTVGNVYDLRDSFDFRPQVSNTATNTSNITVSSINPLRTSSLPGGEAYIVSPETSFDYSASYNVGRIDKLVVSSLGEFIAIEGTPSEKPVMPADIPSTMTLATVYIPPAPSLTLLENTALNRPEYTIKSQTFQTKRYTMKDIAGLESRLQNVEYYTALNMLESKTKNLVIKSDVTGSEVFKNGIFVDDFADQVSADVNNPEFRIGYDTSETSIVPLFESSKIGLKYSSGTQVTGETATIPFTEVEFASQNTSTRYRDCTNHIWNFRGTTMLNPSFVYLPDLRYPGVVLTPTVDEKPFSGINPITSTQYIQGQLDLSFCSNLLAASPYLSEPSVTVVDTSPTNAPDVFASYTSGFTFNGSFVSPLNALDMKNSPFPYINAPFEKLYDTLNRRFNVSAYTYAAQRQKNKNFTPISGQIGLYWHSMIEVPESGTWTFYGTHDDGMILYIDGNIVYGDWSDGTARTGSGAVSLQAGRKYRFQLFYYNAGAKASAACRVEAQGPTTSRQNIPYSWFYMPVAYSQIPTPVITPDPTPAPSFVSPPTNTQYPNPPVQEAVIYPLWVDLLGVPIPQLQILPGVQGTQVGQSIFGPYIGGSLAHHRKTLHY